MSSPAPHARQLTFHEYADPPARSQTESFQRVQRGMYAKHPVEAKLLQQVALRLAAERGRVGFTAADVLDGAGGRERFPRNLIGAVLGMLRARHAICVCNRVKASQPAGKGRFVNVFVLNADALAVEAGNG